RDRAADVLRVRERHDAGDAREAFGRAQAEQVVHRGWDTDGAAGVGAPRDGGEACGDGGAATAARAAGIPLGVVRVTRLSGDGADGRDAARELVHVRFGEYDGAGVSETFHLKGVVARLERGEGERAGGGRHVARSVVVLENNRNAVQRTANLPRFPLGVHRG